MSAHQAYPSVPEVSLRVVFGCTVVISLFEANAERAASFPSFPSTS